MAYSYKFAERGTLIFEHNWVQIETLCAPSLEAPSRVITISEAKISKKWRILNRYVSVTTHANEKKFVFFEHTTSALYHGHIHLFRLG